MHLKGIVMVAVTCWNYRVLFEVTFAHKGIYQERLMLLYGGKRLLSFIDTF